MRFRGWPRRPLPLLLPMYGPPPGAPIGPIFACRPMPFDLALCEASFPRSKEFDDSDLAQAITKRHQEITPTPVEQTAIHALVSKIKAAIEKISATPHILPSVVSRRMFLYVLRYVTAAQNAYCYWFVCVYVCAYVCVSVCPIFCLALSTRETQKFGN
ncbi:unnamed protein product [Gongylonema pulchrum]|uniref:DZF domain-containing protein n=1 Tax=Gongylonema pulchrum TaxID=637853 RepID=A0A183E546_9BILA|nr:unnamed protein product [Gongylonema pulchrum]